MGNRAVIRLNGNTPAIYLHWNGGLESVLGFLAAAKELKFRDPCGDPGYGMAYLQAAVAIFFGDGASTGTALPDQLDTDNGDNGTYVLGPGFTIAERQFAGRESGKLTAEDLTPAEAKKMQMVRDGVVARWRAAMAIGEAD